MRVAVYVLMLGSAVMAVAGGSSMLPKVSDDLQRVVTYDELRLGGLLSSGSRFELTVSTAPYNANVELKTFWGNDSDKPTTLLRTLEVLVDGKRVQFPRKATEDLCDINLPGRVHLMQSADELFVYLGGGDAAGAYTAVLRIIGGHVVSREIRFINASGDQDVVTETY